MTAVKEKYDALTDPGFISLGIGEEPPPTTGVLEGRIASGHPTILYGDGGQGKSHLALALAVGIASGLGLAGMPMPQGAAAFIDWELSCDEQKRRAFKIARGLNLSKPPESLWYYQPSEALPTTLARIRSAIKRYGLSLVVIDSIGLACGTDPESAREMISLFRLISELNVSTLLIDHQSKLQEGQDPKNKRPFGSVYKTNLARSVLHIQKAGGGPGSLKIRLRHIKNNFGHLCQDLGLSITFHQDSISFLGVNGASDPDFAASLGSEESIMATIRARGSVTSDEVSRKTGLPVKTVANIITKLRAAKKITEAGKSVRKSLWRLAETNVPAS